MSDRDKLIKAAYDLTNKRDSLLTLIDGDQPLCVGRWVPSFTMYVTASDTGLDSKLRLICKEEVDRMNIELEEICREIACDSKRV